MIRCNCSGPLVQVNGPHVADVVGKETLKQILEVWPRSSNYSLVWQDLLRYKIEALHAPADIGLRDVDVAFRIHRPSCARG